MSGRATIRQTLCRSLYLPAVVGSEIGIISDQYMKLRNGSDVELAREQLAGFITAHDLEHDAGVTDLSIAERWRLVGDDQLSPINDE